MTSTRQSNERDIPRIIRHRERKFKEAQREAIDGFIKAMNKEPIDEQEIKKAALALGKAEVSIEQIENEVEKKKLTPILRAFLNLPKRGQARNIELLEFTKQKRVFEGTPAQ